MEVKTQSDGSIVKNCVNELNNDVSDLYDRITATAKIAQILGRETGLAQQQAYADMLNNVQLNGMDFGWVQKEATENSMRDYRNYASERSIPTEAPKDFELDKLKEGNILDKIHSHEKFGYFPFESEEEVQVPVSVDGTLLPLLVTSNDFSKKTATLEEAKDTLEGVMAHIQGLTFGSDVDTNVADESNSTNNTKSDSDGSNTVKSVRDPTQVYQIGQDTIDRLENGGFDVVPSNDVSEHIEVPKFEFEKDDSDGGNSGMPSPKEIIDLQDKGWSKDEIKEMYCE
jgi:hypothetical protein